MRALIWPVVRSISVIGSGWFIESVWTVYRNIAFKAHHITIADRGIWIVLDGLRPISLHVRGMVIGILLGLMRLRVNRRNVGSERSG